MGAFQAARILLVVALGMLSTSKYLLVELEDENIEDFEISERSLSKTDGKFVRINGDFSLIIKAYILEYTSKCI